MTLDTDHSMLTTDLTTPTIKSDLKLSASFDSMDNYSTASSSSDISFQSGKSNLNNVLDTNLKFSDAPETNIFNEKNNNIPPPASPQDVNLNPELITKNVISLQEALEDGRRMMILFIDNRCVINHRN